MKIGIVTQPLRANYGGFLQAWALQEKLRKMGHSPITIDYLYGSTPWNILLLSWIKTCILCCIGKKRPFAKLQPPAERPEIFDTFVRKNMSLTERIHKYSERLVEKYEFEAVITGSDQVWRPCYNTFLEDMYLRFVHGENIKKIAYAASFGVDNWEYSFIQTLRCRRLAKRFNAISVREDSGVTLCKDCLHVNRRLICQP